MSQTAESKIKKLVKELLISYDIQPASKAGSFESAAGWFFMPVPWGVRGIPDFIGHYHGKFFGIETKAPGKTPTQFQKLQISSIVASGADVFIVDSEKSLERIKFWLSMIRDEPK